MATATTRSNKPAATAAPKAEPAQETAKKTRVSSAALLDELAKIEIVADDEPAPFAVRGEQAKIPEDHPLVKAFLDTYEHGRVAKFKTDKPDEMINIVRRVAAQSGKGVRTSVHTLDGKKVVIPTPPKGEKRKKYAEILAPGTEVFLKFMATDRKKFPKKGAPNATSGQSSQSTE